LCSKGNLFYARGVVEAVRSGPGSVSFAVTVREFYPGPKGPEAESRRPQRKEETGMRRNRIQGALVATAVAALFASAPALAAEQAAGKGEVKCMGANSCKGKGSCAGAHNDCAGKNECKGKGWVKAKSKEECEKMGGKVES
jgi:uncharacterized membrane protein